ncbi:hypothetical protein WKT07_10590 [Mediterraneibacter sp. HCN-7094]
MTNFSLVSIPFCLMVADTVGIANLFPAFYLCICLVGIILAVIIATYTPFFKWVSYPMGLYLQLFGVEEAFAVAPGDIGRIYRYVYSGTADHRHYIRENCS